VFFLQILTTPPSLWFYVIFRDRPHPTPKKTVEFLRKKMGIYRQAGYVKKEHYGYHNYLLNFMKEYGTVQ